MHYVYIIRSLKTSAYYIGESPDYKERLHIHNDPIRNTNTTKSGLPWEIYWWLEVADRSIARKIEQHIKKMKSRKYIENLKHYPEISQKLIEKYGVPGSPR